MSYYESAEGLVITRERAKQEIAKHGADWAEFIADNGEREEYAAQDVLAWLGY